MKVFIQKEKPGSLAQMNRILNDNHGQSLAEFILTFGIVCIVIILFVKIAFNFTKGYMIHYANFMASRSYMVQDNNSSTPETADANAKTIAKKVFSQIFDAVKSSDIVVLSPSAVDNKVFVGVKTSIEENFSLSPMVGGGEKIKMVSESFLGREPVISECARGTCAAISEITDGSCVTDFSTLWDNGC
jgi:hypothetical protein